MGSDNQIEKSSQTGLDAEVKTSESRRKLIRGALIGAPVLLALKSTPVLACNCKLPSGFSTSGNLSRNKGATCTQPAHPPSYWKTHYSSTTLKFTGTNCLVTTSFNSIFGPPNDPQNRMFKVVLQSGDNLSSLVVAAYLGIKSNYFVSGITIPNIKAMWRGSYRLTGGPINWTPYQCEHYLRYVMGLQLLP